MQNTSISLILTTLYFFNSMYSFKELPAQLSEKNTHKLIYLIYLNETNLTCLNICNYHFVDYIKFSTN